MKHTPICLGICAAGVALIVAGVIWSQVVGDRMSWSEEQAIEFNKVSATYHQAAHAHSDHAHGESGHHHGEEQASAEALAAAKGAWQEQMRRRDTAIARREFWRKLLMGSGMSAIFLGGLSYIIVNRVMEDD